MPKRAIILPSLPGPEVLRFHIAKLARLCAHGRTHLECIKKGSYSSLCVVLLARSMPLIAKGERELNQRHGVENGRRGG